MAGIKRLIFMVLLVSVIWSSFASSDYSKLEEMALRVTRINPNVGYHEAYLLVKVVFEKAEKYEINPNIMLKIIEVESTFKNPGINYTGDYGWAQINYQIWKKEFKRLGYKPLNSVLLKTSVEYNIEIMARILAILRDRYPNERKWYTRYHSSTPVFRIAYKNKLKKAKIID